MIADEILELVKEINPLEEIDCETLLVETEVLDSMAIILLIEELESKYDITIPFDEIEIDYFKSVLAIAEYVKERIDEKK